MTGASDASDNGAMTVHAAKLPFSLDPLITEAKRRMRPGLSRAAEQVAQGSCFATAAVVFTLTAVAWWRACGFDRDVERQPGDHARLPVAAL